MRVQRLAGETEALLRSRVKGYEVIEESELAKQIPGRRYTGDPVEEGSGRSKGLHPSTVAGMRRQADIFSGRGQPLPRPAGGIANQPVPSMPPELRIESASFGSPPIGVVPLLAGFCSPLFSVDPASRSSLVPSP